MLEGVTTRQGYRYMYVQLDGTVIDPRACVCGDAGGGSLACPIDDHRIRFFEQYPGWPWPRPQQVQVKDSHA